MSDVVERLNRGEGCLEEGGKTCISMDAESGCICAIAADEIARLRAENERLQAALKPIPLAFKKAIIEARAALEEK